MKISILIVTKNRFEDLVKTLTAYRNQTYKNIEIIIVDNQSTDETRNQIPLLFPEAKYIWMCDNFEIKGLNIAYSLCDGDIIWRGDDDSFPESYDTLERVIEIFNSNQNIDIICSEDIEVTQGNMIWEWYPEQVDKVNIPSDGYFSNSFAGTGVGIRRKVIESIGGFWGFGFEEIDFSTRAIIAGFNLRYFPNIRVLHFASKSNRPNSWRFLKFIQQYVKYKFKYLPLHKAIFYSTLNLFLVIPTAIYQRVPFLVIISGLLSILPIAIEVRQLEYKKLDNETLAKITFNYSELKVMKNYIKRVLSNKIFKRKIK